MKIALYCTNNYPYPVPAGTIFANITVAGNLADQLTLLGHDVTLFAPEGTVTKAHLETFSMSPFSNPQIYERFPDETGSYEYENLMLIRALNYSVENGFDIFHSHCRPFSIVNYAPLKPELPTVITIHDPVDYPAYNILPEFNQFQNLHFVSISQSQQAGRPNLKWSAVIHNGIDPGAWPFNPNPENYLLFVGRIIPEKGPDIAIQIAQSLNLPLHIYGSIYPKDQSFFDTKIKPFLSGEIRYFGPVDQRALPEIYGHAQALLMPSRWSEPFGLVAIEAMATGTPVLATANGALPEIILDDKTGYLLPDLSLEAWQKALQALKTIDRAACRTHVEKNFSLAKTAQSYLSLYSRILGSS